MRFLEDIMSLEEALLFLSRVERVRGEEDKKDKDDKDEKDKYEVADKKAV